MNGASKVGQRSIPNIPIDPILTLGESIKNPLQPVSLLLRVPYLLVFHFLLMVLSVLKTSLLKNV